MPTEIDWIIGEQRASRELTLARLRLLRAAEIYGEKAENADMREFAEAISEALIRLDNVLLFQHERTKRLNQGCPVLNNTADCPLKGSPGCTVGKSQRAQKTRAERAQDLRRHLLVERVKARVKAALRKRRP